MEYSQDEDEDEDEDSKIVSRHREQFLIKLPSKFIAAFRTFSRRSPATQKY